MISCLDIGTMLKYWIVGSFWIYLYHPSVSKCDMKGNRKHNQRDNRHIHWAEIVDILLHTCTRKQIAGLLKAYLYSLLVRLVMCFMSHSGSALTYPRCTFSKSASPIVWIEILGISQSPKQGNKKSLAWQNRLVVCLVVEETMRWSKEVSSKLF
jgi:hypothetical protein